MSEMKFLLDDSPIPVNPELVWDYEIPPLSKQSDAFRRWYIARVLARGRFTDVETVGLAAIYHYWPTLHLPAPVYQFWSWYLNLPEVKKLYGNLDTIPAPSVEGYRPNTARP